MESKYAICTGGNKVVGAEIQERLFALGYRWEFGQPHTTRNAGERWLFIYCNTGIITHSDSNHINDKELYLEDLFLNGDKIKIATAKEMTLPEIIKELGYEVKIVK